MPGAHRQIIRPGYADGVSLTTGEAINTMHVIDMIFFWADMEPSRPAIMLPDRMLTYRGLANAIEAIEARLAEHNLDKNETVAVALENETLLLATCFAALRSGLTVAPAQRS